MPNQTHRSGRTRSPRGDQRTSRRCAAPPRRRRAEFVALQARASCGPPNRKRRHTRKAAALFFLVLAILLVVPDVPAIVSDPPIESGYWRHNAPVAHGNPLRSGYVDVELSDPPIGLLWQNRSAEPILAAAVMDEHRVYTIERSGLVRAHALTTGTTLWTQDLEEEVSATPALAYGWLYVATLEGTLFSLESHTGTLMQEQSISNGARAPTLASEGRVFQGTDTGILHVMDAETLTEIWRFDTKTLSYHNGTIDQQDDDYQAEIRSAPAVHENRVYFTAWNGHAYGMSIHANPQGHPESFWKREIGDAVKAGPAFSHHHDRVLVPTKDGRLTALHPTTGNPTWQSQTSASFIAGIATDGTQTIARTSDAVLFSLNATTGAKQWSFTDPSGHLAAPVLTRDAIVQATGNGTLSLLSRTNGALLDHPDTRDGKARWALQGAIHQPPAVSRNAIAVVDHSGTLSVFGPPIIRNVDLEALSISVLEIGLGSEKTLELGVRNNGPDLVPEIHMRIERNGALHAERVLEGLDPEEERTWPFVFQAPPGTHELVVTFQARGATEADPDSARTSRTFTLTDLDAFDENETAMTDPELGAAEGGEDGGSFAAAVRTGMGWAAGPGIIMGLVTGVFAARRLRGTRIMATLTGTA
jgi:outer membrane protein assembly factor BamB